MSTNKDTAFTSSSESTDDMLEAISVTGDSTDDDSIIANEKKNERRRLIYVSIGGAVAIALIIGGIFLVPTVKGGKVPPASTVTATTGTKAKASSAIPSGAPGADQNFAKTNQIPFEHENWQADDYKTQTNNEGNTQKFLEAIRTSIEAGKLDNGTLALASSTLPSEAAGYTSDQDQVTLEDGSLNPMYAYWTKELFETEVGTTLERLLNPTFGGWENYQYPEYQANTQFDTSIISDMFTPNWLETNTGKPYNEYVPVMADWGSDNYGGGYNLTDVARWYGQIQTSSIDFNYNEETQQYTAVYTANIKYTAWTKDQKTVERTGTLTLNLVPAASQQNSNGSSHRVLIDSATLKVDN